MTEVIIFGDSITYGAEDIEMGGWVQRLRKFLDEKSDYSGNSEDYYVVYNLGISGDNSFSVLERFEEELKRRIREGRKRIIIFAIGTNDASFKKSLDNYSVRIEDFEKNIRNLSEKASKYTGNVIFVGLFPVDESKSQPYFWNADLFKTNKSVEEYNNVLKNVCLEKKIGFVDIFSQIKKLDYLSLLSDGLHPNSAGHQKLFEMVRDFIVNANIL